MMNAEQFHGKYNLGARIAAGDEQTILNVLLLQCVRVDGIIEAVLVEVLLLAVHAQ
jgi:hypothetical protein